MNMAYRITNDQEKGWREWLKRYGEMTATVTSGLFIVLAWIVSTYSEPWSIALYLTAFVVGGYVSAKEGLQTLIVERDLDVNLLMIIAAIGACVIGYWTEGAILIFIFSLSGTLETYTMNRSHRDISTLINMQPETAVLYEDGVETIITIDELTVGDTVLVKPGEKIPADGIVQKGVSAVDQSTITGESIPVDKKAGDDVFAGTLNGQGALFITVTQSSESTLFAKIIRLVQEAKSEKPVSQLFMERFERLYARVIILISFLLIVIPPLVGQWTWTEAFYRTMVFLVVASPCALVASIMPAMLSGISNSARKGVLFKGGAHLENLANTKVVAFDKTGTLTMGKPVVTDIIPLQHLSEAALLQAAASLESLSGHPLAQAIVDEAQTQGLTIEHPTDFQTLTGWGVQGRYDDELWKIGKPSFLDEYFRTDKITGLITSLEQEGKTVTIVQNESGAAGIIALRDTIRPEAKLAVAALKKLGMTVAMLTGDQEQTAKAIGKELGIPLIYANLLPEEKVHHVQVLQQQYGSLTMVGDGVNDAPALATASVGVAMGIAGSDTALDTADLVLTNDDIVKLPEAIVLGRRAKSAIRQNIIFSLSVIILLIVFNFTLGISLPLGVIGHEGSTILVILNGLRLLR